MDWFLYARDLRHHHPTCSIPISDFNVERSKWYASDKIDTADLELDNITTTSDYSRMTEKPIHFAKGSPHALT